MFICRDCRQHFLQPSKADYGFSHAFGYHKEVYDACPYCESTDIEEATVCFSCAVGSKLKDDILCDNCKERLHKRIKDFFDSFTAEEEEQFDAWIDGRSITEREYFYEREV